MRHKQNNEKHLEYQKNLRVSNQLFAIFSKCSVEKILICNFYLLHLLRRGKYI